MEVSGPPPTAPIQDRRESLLKLKDQVLTNICENQEAGNEQEKIKNINTALEIEEGLINPNAQPSSPAKTAPAQASGPASQQAGSQDLKYESHKTDSPAPFVRRENSTAVASQRGGKSEVSFLWTGVSPQDSDISTASYEGIEVNYGLNDWLAVGFSGGWAQTTLNVTDAFSSKVSGGDIVLVPLFADFIVRAPSGPVRPYGVVGFGTVIPFTTSGALNNDNLKSKPKIGPAEKVGAGLDWFFSKNMALYCEADYIFNGSKLEIETEDTDTQTDEKSFDFWYVGGGLKVLFD